MSEIRTVGICGAGGTMGAGIAIVAARAGFTTISYDRSEEALERSRKDTAAFIGKSVERGKLTPEERDRTLDAMRTTTKLEGLGQCDLVIEAVFEELSVKRDLVRTLDAVCDASTIVASNTSTLSITEIAAGSKRPDKVVGMHFCLPAQMMKLIEMSPGLLTSDETFQTAWKWTEKCGQIPVKTQDKPGFILNALLVPFNNDAIRAVEAGVAEPADIDKALRAALGYKMGPLELIDLIGLDTQVRLSEAFYPITLDGRAAAPPLLRRMVAAGLLGRKSGRGFFRYEGEAMFGA
ncbi:MAG: 3-hydroxyacyl-CoA dehydrogenase family protein [Mesorhizobium sp.]|uniref:3-hydroxyacyl-CoA dehydrogenase family protein n=1 Tax=Mesorhizobium sp. TaxID=1871066 RepID=UPI0011FD9C24|nr:3-hydroxyacyl-CoA dehydrogenase family protein [Mesorhizobium sp.]TIL32455.1 MAG: 3-hydroxyacyl-CoA dehydrogenase family protein [Mesorhizobium sp.]TIM40332.1 MAG: 3-hydroxyacyl-CoA dehydrogenase family protein [Mesorhizobium sp.]